MRDAEQRLPRLSAVAVAAFAVLTLIVVMGWTQGIDDWWNSAMVSGEAAPLLTLAEAFHWVGSFEPALWTSVAIGVSLMVLRRWTLVVAWIAMVGGSQILSQSTKALIGRERPLNGLVEETSAAYPSGHAMVAGAAMAIGLALIVGVLWPRYQRTYLWVGIVYSILMAWSRTYLRAHWLSDVVGGLLFGSAVVFAVMWLVLRRAEAEPT